MPTDQGWHRWRDDAACLDVDPEWFVPDTPDMTGEATEAAKRVCRRCPVREPCLDYALSLSIDRGVWGGLSASQRRRLTARR